MAFNAKRYSPDAFTQGVWLAIMGGQFKVARAGNPIYEQALEESGYRKKIEPAEKERALYTAIATGVLRDWSGVEDDSGEPIPYSIENAVEVMLDNPDLVARILSQANDLSNFRREDIEDQGKKPRQRSNTA
ncbi:MULTISPECIES: hypothetical protein [unclassified Halomonas]|uniref:hypothetical protein n=1 Tax=unclassified Halomonas TaxID=2609666 RepID=UPI001BCC039D|nr:hypothetical protein [Halomonas sp.]MBR9878687.1 hypothetical protein [Gammaproteobacteria bacterium]